MCQPHLLTQPGGYDDIPVFPLQRTETACPRGGMTLLRKNTIWHPICMNTAIIPYWRGYSMRGISGDPLAGGEGKP